MKSKTVEINVNNVIARAMILLTIFTDHHFMLFYSNSFTVDKATFVLNVPEEGRDGRSVQ